MRHNIELTKYGKITVIGLLAVILAIGMLYTALKGGYAWNYFFIFVAMPLLVTGICNLVWDILDND